MTRPTLNYQTPRPPPRRTPGHRYLKVMAIGAGIAIAAGFLFDPSRSTPANPYAITVVWLGVVIAIGGFVQWLNR